MEDLEPFRLRVRRQLAASMPPLPPGGYPYNPMACAADERFARQRSLQRALHDAGLAGLSFPVVAGGQGLPPAYQSVLVEESEGYEMPLRFTMPTLGIIGATIVDFGTPEQQARFIPPMLRGDTLWVQLLSEPSCGSDLAGVRMRADRDGDAWSLTGEKVWSSAAYGCDWGMCLARTDWSVPKHAGLTMFAIDLTAPGVEVLPIRQVDGSEEFCSVILDGTLVRPDQVIGEVNGGWTVATALMGHERDSVGGGSPYIGNVHIQHGPTEGRGRAGTDRSAALDEVERDRLAGHHVAATVGDWLVERVGRGVAAGTFSGPVGAILRLHKATTSVLEATTELELEAMGAVVWDRDRPSAVGVRYVRRQANCLAGGSNEMQRNLISERLLGAPREPAADRGRPFSEVATGRRSEEEARP